MILYPKILYYTIITSFICLCIAHQYYEKAKKLNKKRCGSDVYNYVANKHTTDWNPRNWNKLMTVFKSLMYPILNTWKGNIPTLRTIYQYHIIKKLYISWCFKELKFVVMKTTMTNGREISRVLVSLPPHPFIYIA